jgi:pimeloyl-ACP methyl ester carboxylesterase
MTDQPKSIPTPGAAFSTAFVEADGFRIRYREAGTGEPLVCLHGGGGLRISGAHDILSKSYRVIAFEIPGFGDSPTNERSKTLEDLGGTMNAAVAALGLQSYHGMANSFGAKLALWMAILKPDAVKTMVLVGPAAIRLDSRASPAQQATPQQAAALLYAHPERQPPYPPLSPEVEAKQRALTRRLLGPPRDPAFEARLAGIETQTLALFGTADRVTPPEAGRLYREVMKHCHLVMVYDAAHATDADRPEAVAEVVADFLKRQESFLVRQKSSLIHP